MVLPTMPAVASVHKEVTAHHGSEEGIISYGAGGYIENEDCRQGDEQSDAQDPYDDRDPEWPS